MAGNGVLLSEAFYFSIYNPSGMEQDLILNTRHAKYIATRQFRSAMGTSHMEGYMVLHTRSTIEAVRCHWGFERCLLVPVKTGVLFSMAFREVGHCEERGSMNTKLLALNFFERSLVNSMINRRVCDRGRRRC